MYITAAYILEHLTNKSFPEFMTERILKPLGMSSSSYNFQEVEPTGMVADGFLATATGDPNGEGRRGIVYKPVPFFDPDGQTSVVAGAGGVISNANDMVRDLLPPTQ